MGLFGNNINGNNAVFHKSVLKKIARTDGILLLPDVDRCTSMTENSQKH